jgi:hypothetical protein
MSQQKLNTFAVYQSGLPTTLLESGERERERENNFELMAKTQGNLYGRDNRIL